MVDSSLLDTGVVFGYCVPLDNHHDRCSEYVENVNGTLYTTQTVETEFGAMKHDRIQELSNAVLDHRRSVAEADLDGTLGPTDVDHLRNRVLDSDSDAAPCLYRFYDDLGSFVNRGEVLDRLSELAREVERVALQRKEALDVAVEEWRKRDDHPTVRSSLSAIHRTDRRICIEAHDLACNTDGETELATVNPRDFVDDGREELILDATEIDAVRDLAVRR